MIFPPQSLKKVLESSGSDYDYSIISRQIIESEKILQPESVERSFAFRWFRDMLPINETTALSDAETKKLVGLPRGTQKLIFSILGSSVPVSYPHLDVYKRQAYRPSEKENTA